MKKGLKTSKELLVEIIESSQNGILSGDLKDLRPKPLNYTLKSISNTLTTLIKEKKIKRKKDCGQYRYFGLDNKKNNEVTCNFPILKSTKEDISKRSLVNLVEDLKDLIDDVLIGLKHQNERMKRYEEIIEQLKVIEKL